MTQETWLVAAPESAVVARALVREEAGRHGLDEPAVWDLMLATTEAIANAVQHGAPCERGIRLAIESNDHGLRVEVYDCGCGHAKPPPTSASGRPRFGEASTRATRGRGLPIIEAVTDSLELSTDGPPAWVRFEKLSRTSQAAGGASGR